MTSPAAPMMMPMMTTVMAPPEPEPPMLTGLETPEETERTLAALRSYLRRWAALYPEDEDRLEFLHRHFSPKVQAELACHPNQETATSTQVLDLLARVYGDHADLGVVMMDFVSSTQGEDETAADFGAGVMQRFTRLRKTQAKTPGETPSGQHFLVATFIRGLRYPLLRATLKARLASNPAYEFIDCRSFASSWESEWQVCNAPYPPRHDPPSPSAHPPIHPCPHPHIDELVTLKALVTSQAQAITLLETRLEAIERQSSFPHVNPMTPPKTPTVTVSVTDKTVTVSSGPATCPPHGPHPRHQVALSQSHPPKRPAAPRPLMGLAPQASLHPRPQTPRTHHKHTLDSRRTAPPDPWAQPHWQSWRPKQPCRPWHDRGQILPPRAPYYTCKDTAFRL